MNTFDYRYKIITLGDRGVGRTTLEDYLDRIYPFYRRYSIRDQIKDIDNIIDEYRVLRENSNSFIKRLLYSLRIKREIKKKNRKVEYLESKNYRSTIGVSFQKEIVKIRGNRITLLIWALGDQELFKDLQKFYFESTKGALIIYDITNSSSLNKIPEWREMIAEHCGEIPIVLIGNKLDLEEQRVISKEMGYEVRKKNNLSSFMEISAETGENIKKMFELIGELILNDYLNE